MEKPKRTKKINAKSEITMALTDAPPTTEQTKAQIKESPHFSFGASLFPPVGHGPPPSGTYDVFRSMAQTAVIYLGTSIATQPIIGSAWDYKAKKHAPKDALDLIRDTFEPIKEQLVLDCVRAIQMGWQPFEVIYQEKEGRVTYKKLKPLLQDRTKILVDKNTGSYAGLKADDGTTELGVGKSFVYSHNMQVDDRYGFSRYMVAKDSWHKYNFVSQKCSEYLKKTAAVLFILHYPEGKSIDATGRELDNSEAAKAVVSQLQNASAISMTNTLYPGMDNMLNSSIPPEKLRAWTIEMLETNAAHGQEFTNLMEYYDKCLLRSLLVAESTALTGTHGNLATAAEHADVSLALATQTLREMLIHINKHLVNRLLLMNYNDPKVENSVCIVADPVMSDARNLQKEIIRMLFSPQNYQLTETFLNVSKMLESAGLPSMEQGIARQYAESYLIDKANLTIDQDKALVGQTGQPDTRPRANQEPNMERTGPMDD
jgi:hypothetical protein